jgi:hypothetical protein
MVTFSVREDTGGGNSIFKKALPILEKRGWGNDRLKPGI